VLTERETRLRRLLANQGATLTQRRVPSNQKL